MYMWKVSILLQQRLSLLGFASFDTLLLSLSRLQGQHILSA